jgi:hypothetical protein
VLARVAPREWHEMCVDGQAVSFEWNAPAVGHFIDHVSKESRMSKRDAQGNTQKTAQQSDSTVKPPLNPGDQASPGTPGTGESLCPDCSGTGKLKGKECATCGGTGRVIQGIGGA